MLTPELKKILDEIDGEEETENHLIWLYKTLLDLGIENCLVGEQQESFRQGMTVLYEESIIHKQIIRDLKAKYLNL